MTRAVIFGCAGTALDAEERAFFRDCQPAGLILFGRNVTDPDQLRALIDDFRTVLGRENVMILIDQEGGRVARLRPPHWREMPPPAVFGILEERRPGTGVRAASLNAALLAGELRGLGINVDCTPVLDLRLPGAHGIIGDRSFGSEPAIVSSLGRAVCESLIAGGVLPVIKHLPGHGRARVDSHEALPIVETPLAELGQTDFAPFRALADMPLAMTAHVVYTAVDAGRAATVSPKAIAEAIRGEIGFDGLLVSDDLGMRALGGRLGESAAAALGAGCDAILHCSGDLAEMREIAERASLLSGQGRRRLDTALSRIRAPAAIDREAATQELGRLMEGIA